MHQIQINTEVQNLGLPSGSCMVVGSGILHTLGIRASGDIDLLVTDDVFELIRLRKWKSEILPDGAEKLTHGNFDLMKDWYGKSFADMVKDAEYIDDVPYMSLADVYAWKKTMGRPKDAADLRLIESYWLRTK